MSALGPARGALPSMSSLEGAVLDLQRAAGNRAVAATVQRNEITVHDQGETLYNQTTRNNPSVPAGQAAANF